MGFFSERKKKFTKINGDRFFKCHLQFPACPGALCSTEGNCGKSGKYQNRMDGICHHGT